MATKDEILNTITGLAQAVDLSISDLMTRLSEAERRYAELVDASATEAAGLKATIIELTHSLEAKIADLAGLQGRYDSLKAEYDAHMAGHKPPLSDDLQVIRTRSGTWRLNIVDKKSNEVAVYRMTLDENPAFERFIAVRRAALKDANEALTVDKLPITLGGIAATVVRGGVRVVQNMDPVPPKPEWVREAVAQGRTMAYRRERDWKQPADVLKVGTVKPYDPMMIAPRSDGTEGSANNNYIGVTSSQGGEYTASRSFIHNEDCRVIDAALHGEDDVIASQWPHIVNMTFYSLAMPGAAMWSMVNDVTADPQIPMAGDRPWEIALWSSPKTDDGVDSVLEMTGWGRDTAHLENTGYVHWLATEDPIAGLVVQRQLAYGLGEYYNYLRPKGMSKYRGYKEQERGVLNVLSALWKSLDVAKGCHLEKGEKLLWDFGRVARMALDVFDYYAASYADPVENSTPAQPREYLAKMVGIPFNELSKTSAEVLPKNPDGTYPKAKVVHNSAFMGVQYGIEPLFLWAKAGNVRAKKWLAGYARWIVGRLHFCGGSKGVDRCPDVAGSGMMVSYQSAAGDYTLEHWSTLKEYGEWLARFPTADTGGRTDSFAGAYQHTAQRCEAMLLAAKALNLEVEALDEAIAHVQETKAKTDMTKLRGLNLGSYLKACVAPE